VGTGPAKQHLYQVRERKDGGAFLQAGEAEGISKGARFAIYGSEQAKTSSLLGYMTAGDPRPLKTILHHESRQGEEEPFKIPSIAQALQISTSAEGKSVSVLVNFEDDKSLCARVIDKMKAEPENGELYHLDLVSDARIGHELALIRESGQYSFEITDKISNDEGLKRLPYTYPVNGAESHLNRVFASAAEFYHHLRRTNRQMLDSPSLVDIRAHALEVKTDFSSFKTILKPRDESEDLNNNGVMHPIMSESIGDDDDPEYFKYYGFNIVNKADFDIYVWVFAFEMNKLSIGEYVLYADVGCFLY
jgi:hypothetical protein